MQPIKIDRTKLITQAEYARKKGLSRARINQMISEKLINTVVIQGATLVYEG
jgi:hypothetical protein